jgi:hypothetical protein
MTAIEWDYFVPWEPGVLRAFNKLQRQVGDQMGFEPQQAALRALMDGTGTVVDFLAGTSERNYLQRARDERLAAFAVPAGWLLEAYETLRPTRRMVLDKPMKQLETIEPGTAVYCAVSAAEEDQGDPTWWYFYGRSE